VHAKVETSPLCISKVEACLKEEGTTDSTISEISGAPKEAPSLELPPPPQELKSTVMLRIARGFIINFSILCRKV
jgi:hypothetical protein